MSRLDHKNQRYRLGHKMVIVRIAAYLCASLSQIWIPEIQYYQKVSSHAQIGPQGAGKQIRKVYVFDQTLNLFIINSIRPSRCQETRRLGWSEARRFCRTRCMDLISLETPGEHRLLARKMKELGVKSVWTSGHLCDHQVSQRSVTNLHSHWSRIIGNSYWLSSSTQSTLLGASARSF